MDLLGNQLNLSRRYGLSMREHEAITRHIYWNVICKDQETVPQLYFILLSPLAQVLTLSHPYSLVLNDSNLPSAIIYICILINYYYVQQLLSLNLTYFEICVRYQYEKSKHFEDKKRDGRINYESEEIYCCRYRKYMLHYP